MSNYIELVVCKHPNSQFKFLFYAPAWTGLKTGDEVIVDTKHGEQPATVLTKTIVEKDSELYNFILESMSATLPLKRVLKKVIYVEMNYEEDENVTDNTGE